MGGGRGTLCTGFLAGRFRQGQKPSHWSVRGNPVPRTGESPVLPHGQWRSGVQSSVPPGQLRTILRLKLQVRPLQEAGGTQKQPRTALRASCQPCQPVDDLF